MSGGENAFLRDFIKMRQSLHKETAPVKPTRKSKATSEALTENATENTLAYLIEKKPKKKDVEEYFQTECNRLTAEKMS